MKHMTILAVGGLLLAGVSVSIAQQKTIPAARIQPGSRILAKSATAMAPQDGPESMQGKVAPAFAMKDIGGKTHTNASLKGKVVLLDFWATWCGPCKMASPIMQSLHTKYGKKGLVVVGANTFERGDTNGAAAKAYAKEHKYTYTFTYGNDKLARSLKIVGIPTMMVIDKSGKIRKVVVGFDESLEKTLEASIKPLLK